MFSHDQDISLSQMYTITASATTTKNIRRYLLMNLMKPKKSFSWDDILESVLDAVA